MTFEEARALFPVLERFAYLNTGTLGPLSRPTLAAVEEPETYDERALRWLVRWVIETPNATIAQAAEIARALVYVPSDSSALEMISSMSNRDGRS